MAKKEVRRTPLNEGVNLLDAFDLMNQRQSTGSLARIQSRRNINQPIDNTESLLANAPSQENMVMPVSNEPYTGFLNTPQQQPNVANNVFGMSNNTQSQTMQQPISDRNQRIGYMLAALSDAFAGRDVAGRAMGRAQIMKQEAEAERQRQQQIQTQETLKQYLNPQQYALYAAGVPFSAIAEFTTKDLSGQQIIENVEQNVEQTIEQTGITDSFANLDEAFGPVDAAQEGLSKATRIFGFDVESETGAAIRARNSLNTEILANLAADFTGKPNLLIYEELKGNLPTTAATSEKDAREKYINIKNQVDARINNLKQGILSSSLSDSDREKYREELNKSSLLSKKLDSAILSLKGKSKNILEPDSNMSSVDFSNLYLELE